jgi:hypothetical protein
MLIFSPSDQCHGVIRHRKPRSRSGFLTIRGKLVSIALLLGTWLVAASPADADGLSLSAQAMPVGDVPGWHQVFADDFSAPAPTGAFSGCVTGLGVANDYCSGLSGTPYFNRWFAYPDGWAGTPASGIYAPSRGISVEHGRLDYYLRTGSLDGVSVHMIEAAVPRIPGGVRGGGLLYGRYVIRARWDPLSNYHISFLLWPDSNQWPRDGEIDYPEGNMASSSVSAFIHWQNGTPGGAQHAYVASTDPQLWHTYEIDWLPSSVSFYLDGRPIGRSTTHVPDTPMHWVLQTNTSSHVLPGDTQAGHVQMDWAAAYVPSR